MGQEWCLIHHWRDRVVVEREKSRFRKKVVSVGNAL